MYLLTHQLFTTWESKSSRASDDVQFPRKLTCERARIHQPIRGDLLQSTECTKGSLGQGRTQGLRGSCTLKVTLQKAASCRSSQVGEHELQQHHVAEDGTHPTHASLTGPPSKPRVVSVLGLHEMFIAILRCQVQILSYIFILLCKFFTVEQIRVSLKIWTLGGSELEMTSQPVHMETGPHHIP